MRASIRCVARRDGTYRGIPASIALLSVVVSLACWLSASPASAATVSPCNPTINPAGTPAPGTVVAPGLRVISTQWGLGNCTNAIWVSSRAADGTLWGTDYSNHVWKSTDDLRTIANTYTAAAYVQVEQVMQLASGTVLISVRDSNGLRHILRSTDSSGTAFASTPVLDLPAGASLHDSNSWVQIGNAIYVGQYGETNEPVSLYKSTNDGQTFTPVWQAFDEREIHAVQADPYMPGRLWMTTDNETDPSKDRWGYSDDGGQTFTWVSQPNNYPQDRVLTLMFDSDAVYAGCDCPDVSGGLYRWDRRTGQISTLMSNLNGPFYDAVGYNGQFAQFTAVEPTNYVGDQYIHVLTNGAGSSWSLTRTRWMRDQTNSTKDANPEGNTSPDSQGRFWIGYYDLSGSPLLEANIEFQFDPTATYNGVSSSFGFSPNPITAQQAVAFDGTSSFSPATPLSYLWNFGDGGSASGATTSYTYGSGGPFSATLQVNDANNDAALSTRTVASVAQRPTAMTAGAPTSSLGATLYGTANPNGAATTAHFEYGTSTAYGSQTSNQSVGSGGAPQSLSAAVAGLQPNTTYHYRLDATNATGTSQGIDRMFTTPPVPTSVTTAAASNVQSFSANGNGNVTPNGLATTVHFDYGTTTAYGSSTSNQAVGTGTSSQAISTQLPSLQANTTYHFRLVAVNEAGTYYGADQPFTTLPPPPSATTTVGTFMTPNGGTLNGTVNANGSPTTVHFEYGPSTAYGSQTPDQSVGSGSTVQPVTAAVSGLQPNTTYHFRLDALNANATTFGADGTFTTAPGPPAATTSPATGVTTSSPTLNGTVDPEGVTTNSYYQYGVNTFYGSQTPTQSLPGNLVANSSFESGVTGWSAGGSPAPAVFQAQTGWASVGSSSCRFTTGTISSTGYSELVVNPFIKGISAGTAYNVSADVNVLSLTSGQRVVLYVTWRDSSGNGLGKVQAAYTKVAGITTLAKTLTAPAGAAQAQADITVENGGVADLYFDNVAMLAAGTGLPQAVSAQVSGLTIGTTYHYRLVATNALGTTYGADQSFTPYTAPAAITSAASGVTSSAATLNASVTPNGAATAVSFQYGTTTSYGSATQSQAAGSGATAVPVSQSVTGLADSTTYHYRVVATNAAGTTFGGDQTFSTADGTPPTSLASSPALSNSNAWSVSWTAADNAGGSGLAHLDLYVQTPGQSGYTLVASDTSGAGSGSFAYNAVAGDGTYAFYTIATDNAGNVQSAPSTAQASTVLDTTPPTSSASSPATSSTASWPVAWTASDSAGGSGLARVDVYAEAPGQTSYTLVASDTSGSANGSFSYTANAGSGAYGFYAVATDQAGNAQAAPSSPQTTTVLSPVGTARDASSAASARTAAQLPDFAVTAPTHLTVRTASTAGRTSFYLTFASKVENLAKAYGASAWFVGLHSRSTASSMPADQHINVIDTRTGQIISQLVAPNVGKFVYEVALGHPVWQLQGVEGYDLRRVSDGRVVRRGRTVGLCLGGGCGRDRPHLRRVVETLGARADRTDASSAAALDLTTLPAGRYVLVVRVNPTDRLVESDYANDVASALVLVSRSGLAEKPSVRVLRSCPDTSSCSLG